MGQYSRHLWTKTIVAIALGSTLLVSCAAGDVPAETEVGEEPNLNKEQTIAAYARSVLEIDRLRRTAYEQIDAANDDNPPPQVMCDNPETVAGLRGEVKQIAVDYCLKAQDIVREQNLTVPIFNDVTQILTEDSQLKAEIENELRRIQQSSGS